MAYINFTHISDMQILRVNHLLVRQIDAINIELYQVIHMQLSAIGGHDRLCYIIDGGINVKALSGVSCAN